MCIIEEVKSYQLFGKLYPTREAALNSGLIEIGTQIKRDHSNDPIKGVLQHRDALLFLLAEHQKLEKALPDKAQEGPAAGESQA